MKDTPMARLIIAGTSSGVGKTTITTGLIAALRVRGLMVQSFKIGPDYIDPTYHTLATGRPCRNLDAWMVRPDRVVASFHRATQDVDVAVIEGVMGLYDGFGYDDEAGSTAAAAKLLKTPVVLVVDACKMARSSGAIALGFRRFDPDLNLAGFIVNRVGSDGHGRGVAAAIEQATELPVFGWLTRDARLAIPERYLGLVPTREPGQWTDFIRAAGEMVAGRLDLDRILTVARQAPTPGETVGSETIYSPESHASDERPVIAVARDEAFHFTYPENLERLESAGAEIAFFSPLRDYRLPDRTAGVMLSGGFPELYATDLSGNGRLHAALRDAHEERMPIYAECGGLMYLTEAIVDGQGRQHPMAGLLPGRSAMSDRLTLGYRLGRAARDSWLFYEGEEIRGHEFHYSSWIDRPVGLPAALQLTSRDGDLPGWPEGACERNLWASYIHIHFDGFPELASRFVVACRSWKSTLASKGEGRQ
jgi:cobyrinic acid a,c-diamide synthase